MKYISKNDIFLISLSIPIGAAILFIYMYFQGVFTALLVDIGYYNSLVSLTSIFYDPGVAKANLFLTINYLKDIFVALLLCIIFLYWITPVFRKKVLISSAALIIGAVIADVIIYFKLLNDFSISVLSYNPFFDSLFLSYSFNIGLWWLIFSLSILLSSAMKEWQSKRVVG